MTTTDLYTDLSARIILSHAVEPGDTDLGELLYERGRTPSAVLESLLNGTLAGTQFFDRTSPRLQFHRRDLAKVHEWLDRDERHFILTPEDEAWPTQLDDLGTERPLILYGVGTIPSTVLDYVAIVGARANTTYGSHITMEIGHALTERGYGIVSGGAYGIDVVAHRAALANRAVTVSFLAGGVDRFYPAGNNDTFERITESGGAVMAELPPGSAPTRWRFLKRNRLIAAFAKGLVVTEAGIRSGSLNAAGHSIGLGRPTMAVPGPITSVASAGCHRLIREMGATLVTNAEEIHHAILGLPTDAA